MLLIPQEIFLTVISQHNGFAEWIIEDLFQSDKFLKLLSLFIRVRAEPASRWGASRTIRVYSAELGYCREQGSAQLTPSTSMQYPSRRNQTRILRIGRCRQANSAPALRYRMLFKWCLCLKISYYVVYDCFILLLKIFETCELARVNLQLPTAMRCGCDNQRMVESYFLTFENVCASRNLNFTIKSVRRCKRSIRTTCCVLCSALLIVLQ